MLLSKIKKIENRCFALSKLPETNLKEIILHLDHHDVQEILVVCKGWFKVLLPIFYEYVNLLYVRYDFRNLRYLKKAKDYVKHLSALSYDSNSIKIKFPNLIKYDTTLSNLPQLRKVFGINPCHLKINRNMVKEDIKEFFEVHQLIPSEIMENVSSLVLDANKLKDFIDPFCIQLIPKNLSCLTLIGKHIDFKYDDIIYNRISLIKYLELIFDMHQGKYLCPLLNNCFQQLTTLDLIIRIDKLTLDLNNFPSLKTLKVEYIDNLYLIGKSNLKTLNLRYIDLSTFSFSSHKFPELRVLILYIAFNMNFKSFYLILQLPKLTLLDLDCYRTWAHLTLLNELYPRFPNNLISLSLIRLYIGNHFLKYLFKSCVKLENLCLKNCTYFSESIPFSNYKRNLSLVSLEVYSDRCINNKLVELLVRSSPNLKTLRITKEMFSKNISLETKAKVNVVII